MKTAQRIAMRAKAKNRWSHDTLPDDDADEALAWHEDWTTSYTPNTSWTPTAEETAAMQAWLAAHPELPF